MKRPTKGSVLIAAIGLGVSSVVLADDEKAERSKELHGSYIGWAICFRCEWIHYSRVGSGTTESHPGMDTL